MSDKGRQLLSYIGLAFVFLAFILGLARLDIAGWVALFIGAFTLAYAFFTGSRPFLRD